MKFFGGQSMSAMAYGVPSISVVGDGFCVPYTMELMVKKKVQGLSNAHFDVFDVSGNLLLQVDGGVWALRRKRVMRDPAGFPILTMREKHVITTRDKWMVHQGERTEEHNFLFRVQRSHPLQLKTQLDVFLASNFSKEISDFHVTGRYSSLSFKVYKGNVVIAEVNHAFTWRSFCKGKDSFCVKVNPEVDYAFIVALLVILEENDGA